MSRKVIDMTGRRIGNWEVIDFAPPRSKGEQYWRCKCACGNIGEVAGSALRLGRSTKCQDCANNKLADLTGVHFGDWVVVERAKNGTRDKAKWLCKNKEGRTRIVFGQNIISSFSNR